MARKFWTLLPESYYSNKQLAKGGRNEILFTAIGKTLLNIGCFIYYLSYRSFHKKP
jgi:hypothetical protein